VKPAVVTLSLGIPAGAYSQTLDAAVRSLVANSSITVVVASGAGWQYSSYYGMSSLDNPQVVYWACSVS